MIHLKNINIYSKDTQEMVKELNEAIKKQDKILNKYDKNNMLALSIDMINAVDKAINAINSVDNDVLKSRLMLSLPVIGSMVCDAADKYSEKISKMKQSDFEKMILDVIKEIMKGE